MNHDEAIATLPYITVQQDFSTVLTDVRDGTVQSEDFWVSCYRLGSEGVHGKVRVTQDGLVARAGVEFVRDGSNNYTFVVGCPALNISPTRVRIPRRTVHGDHKHAITALDVAPDGKRVAAADAAGSIVLHDVDGSPSPNSSTTLPRDTVATALRFFPSGAVLLAATTRYELRVLSAQSSDFGATPRVLTGHRREPTDIGFVGRGRSVLSTAKDGTLRMWDVGAGTQTAMWTSTASAPVFKLALASADAEAKTAWLALGDGSLEAHDLSVPGAGQPVLRSDPGPSPAALHAVAASADGHFVASGSRSGVVRVYDVRAGLGVPLAAWRRNDACIEDIAFDGAELLVAAGDGLPYRASIGAGVRIVEELAGGDCDAVRAVRCSPDGSVWTAADDGHLRHY